MGTTNFTKDTNGEGGGGISIQYSVFGIQIGEWTGRKKGEGEWGVFGAA
jgi:hypothetical protein